MNFIDQARIDVQAGRGGSGCVAFRREKFVPKGGPSGGDGGTGGDVVVIADRHIHTLLDVRYRRRYIAQRGQHGQGDNKTGKSGGDVTIRLPVGTVVRDMVSSEILADLTREGEQVVIARGGRGGRGNARYVSPTNRAPQEWEPGKEGEERTIELELKLLADVGLVGLPNAGKSTLLSRLSAAKPKIADYPFTTLTPNLGIVRVREHSQFVLADIPGLIEGAHEGKGLGFQFLRHIERTKVLAVLLDATSATLREDFETLMEELRSYGHAVCQKPRLVAYTKSDLLIDEFKPLDPGLTGETDHTIISSVSGDHLDDFVQKIWTVLESERKGETVDGSSHLG